MENEKKYPSLKIQNIVVAGRIATSLDIRSIAHEMAGCVFFPRRFPGAVYHLNEPKAVALLFASGKIVVSGISCMENVRKSLDVLIRTLNGLGYATLPEPDVSVTNMVCSYDTGSKINLINVITTFNYENVEYEPEQFPGLVYRIADPKIVALIFTSGKIIFTGAKNIDDVKSAIDQVVTKLDSID